MMRYVSALPFMTSGRRVIPMNSFMKVIVTNKMALRCLRDSVSPQSMPGLPGRMERGGMSRA